MSYCFKTHYFLEKLFFFWKNFFYPLNYFGNLVKNQWFTYVWIFSCTLYSIPLLCRSGTAYLEIREFISGLYILFNWFLCQTLCQYHDVLITVALEYCLKSGRVKSEALFFFLRIALAILDLLWFNIDCRIICSSSLKNVMGSWIRITLNL